MIPILINGPAVEPVGVPEMRAHLRLDGTQEDDLVAGLVTAARLMVEAASCRILVLQTWRVVLDRWPTGRIVRLPLSPLVAVTRVAVADGAGALADLPASAAEAETAADPPRIRVAATAPEPGIARGGIVLEASFGYGPAPESVPEPLRLAIKILVARWFENRGDIAGEQSLPAEALALLRPFGRARI